MFVYVGIDEAGYGPRFGPLVVGRVTLTVPNLPAYPEAEPPRLWQRLSKAVARQLRGAKGRLVIADSKKLKTPAAGLKHLERGCLALAALAGRETPDVGHWLAGLGCDAHAAEDCPPWYAHACGSDWDPLPTCLTPSEIAIDAGLFTRTCERIGVACPDLASGVVLEPRFNAALAKTHSKASVSFEHVARHLDHVWRTFGRDAPLVVVDRQGGRTDYRELLAMQFPEAEVAVVQQTGDVSRYEVAVRAPGSRDAEAPRRMHVSFETQAEDAHMPVALASMVSKYTRELLLARLNRYFVAHIPGLRPSAGYGTDGNRFLRDVEPHCARLGFAMSQLRRDA